MLRISKNEIIDLVPMPDAIVAMDRAFSDFSNGKFIVPNRISMEIGNKNATALIMPAYRTKGKYFTTKVVTVFQNTIADRSSIISSSVIVFDSSNGDMVATMDGESITSLRTGAASGLATKLLAKKNATAVAIFGTGVQAHTQLEAIINSRPVNKIFVFGRNLDSIEKFSSHISDKYSLSSSPGTFNDLNTVDIICTSTPSTESLFEHKHLKPGVHINAIGSFKPFMREIPNDTIVEAKVVVDSLIACKKEAGDLILAGKETNWSFDDITSEIGQIANGDRSGRANDNDITIFKSVGLGFQDLVIAELVLDRINS